MIGNQNLFENTPPAMQWRSQPKNVRGGKKLGGPKCLTLKE